MDKLTLAHEWAMKHGSTMTHKTVIDALAYADAMQAESEKRNKAEVEQKRKEMREMLNAPNTFIEREGQHFDDVEEWQPDWSQAPEWAKWWVATANKSGKITGGWFYESKPEFGLGDGPSVYQNVGCLVVLTDSFGYQGNWQDSLRKRPL